MSTTQTDHRSLSGRIAGVLGNLVHREPAVVPVTPQTEKVDAQTAALRDFIVAVGGNPNKRPKL